MKKLSIILISFCVPFAISFAQEDILADEILTEDLSISEQSALAEETALDAFVDGFMENYTDTESSTGILENSASIVTETVGTNNSNISIPYNGPVFNGPGLDGGANLVNKYLDDKVSKQKDIKELIIGWTNFLLSVTALIAVVALVWAGFLYVTAMGDDGNMEKAKKIIIWVAVGIIVILAAYAIVNTLMKAAFQ